jgi:phosphoglycolate phosphatase
VPGRYKLVVFDWDGTLSDSEERILTSYERAIVTMEAPARTRAELRATIGLTMDVAVQSLYPDRERVFVAEFVNAYRDAWLAPGTPGPRLFPGVAELLSQLTQAGQWMAVATSKSRAGLSRELGVLGLNAHFRATRCGDETASKPDPRMLHELLNETGVTARDAIVIGDSPFDIAMAKAAGVSALAVTWGAGERSVLEAAQPMAFVEQVRDLAKHL